jgi:myotubularin-related protein 6/7/8
VSGSKPALLYANTSKVEQVQVLAGGEISSVTLHLTPHHLILVKAAAPPSPQHSPKKASTKSRPQESWIAYPMIAFCTFRPTPHGSGLWSSIRIRGRDFKFVTLNIEDGKKAKDVYESIKGATCRLGSVEKLHAFVYDPPPPDKKISGWEIYDAKA